MSISEKALEKGKKLFDEHGQIVFVHVQMDKI